MPRAAGPRVRTGLECILQDRSDLIAGRRIGLVTSASAVTADVTSAADALGAVGTLAALLAPEHGLAAHEADGAQVNSAIDAHTGLSLYSLYGETKVPTAAMLSGIDVLVFDIQDVGARFYTYIWTLSYVLEAAAEHDVPVIVLDRPNPIDGLTLEGPLLEPGYASFVGRYLLPLRHGMTVGELARMFDAEQGLGADLTVVPMDGWQREMWYDQTGLPWVPPSPAMPKLETAIVYPGTCLLEGTNVSAGRGTATPFELIGAPWIDAYRLAAALNGLFLPGVRFRPASFRPWADKHAGATCQGVYLHVLNREAFRPLSAGLHIVSVLHSLWPQAFEWLETSWEGRPPHFDLLIGNGWVRQWIDEGRPVDEIVAQWSGTLAQFAQQRQPYLLYGRGSPEERACQRP
ncbi:MAG: exo-beta-N-acetylmuramidase NamZ domain-containing protein [Anaerolineae bacterium]